MSSDYEEDRAEFGHPLLKRRFYPALKAPTPRQWLVFSILVLLTLGTTYLAGGFLFALSLVFILGIHEFGHYWAARRNHVSVSLPYFIPAPPFFIAGTFGAFIIIKDPIPNRGVLMEIGASGPIAGFIASFIALSVGLFLSEVSPSNAIQGVSFGSSLILSALSKLILGVTPLSTDVDIQLHSIAFAGWIGMFITALNLIPVGQLDGGHVVYALLKGKYKMISRVFFLLLFPLGILWQGWWFWAVLIALIGFKPAPLLDENDYLKREHKFLGKCCLFIFIVTFVPVPFEII
ncbi:MAG: site-2 protease family protein [Nitrospinae bacterium CG11_big_fil_rev_8_21_14_0_20_45_15]|nr:MAG: site-2 protease family protein [Nitrospinae bacterium CG11_big_fil_rev_8_21_14_0_20_45_15]